MSGIEENAEGNAAQQHRATDRIKLKPDTMYSGGNGPNPFLGPPTAEDPCHNKDVIKSNDWVAAQLSLSKQALAVSTAVAGNLSKIESLSSANVKNLVRELATLAQINDLEQLKIIHSFTFSAKASLELDTYAKLSPIRGEFTIKVTPATELRRASLSLDVKSLSVPRLIDLLEQYILPQLTGKTAEQTQLPMKQQAVAAAQTMAKQLLDANLSNFSTVAGITDSIVTLQSSFTSNRKLEDFVATNEGDLVLGEETAKAIKTLSNGNNVNERIRTRYQWIVQRIPIIDKVSGSNVRISFKELIADLMQTFMELADAWQEVKGFLSKDQKDAIAMPHDELRRRLQVRDDVLAKKQTFLHAGTKRSNEQSSSSSSSSSTSSSYADKVKDGKQDSSKEDSNEHGGKKKKPKGDHSKNDASSSKKAGESDKSDPPPNCSGCGNGHKYHDQPGFTCPYLRSEHPQANSGEPTKSWAESKAGKAFKIRSGLNRLQFGKAYASDDATEQTDFERMKNSAPKKSKDFRGKPLTDKSIRDRNPFTLMCTLNNDADDDYSTSARTTPFLTIPVVSLSNDRKKVTRELHVKTGLVDTGAVDSDYVSKRLAERLVKDFGVHVHPDATAVNTPFDKLDSVTCLGRVEFNIKIFNEITRQNEFIILDARIIESPLDIIIGRPSIKKNGLLRKCHDQILMDTRVTNIEEHNVSLATYFNNDLWLQLNMVYNADVKNDDDDNNKMEVDDSDDESSTRDEKIETLSSTQTLPPRCTLGDGRTCQCWSQTDEEQTFCSVIQSKVENNDDNSDSVEIDKDDLAILAEQIEELCPAENINARAILGSLAVGSMSTSKNKRANNPDIKPLEGVKTGDIIGKDRLLTHSDDGFNPLDMINHSEDDPQYATKTDHLRDEYKEVELHGSENFKKRILQVLADHKEVFSSTLPAQPARVEPLQFDIDLIQWKQPANQTPHRRQSINKDAEIQRQVIDMMKTNVLSQSDAAAWSQVLLTLKPNGKWRFCIDFRQLNKLMDDRGWPLPRIDELLERVGRQKPTVFGKMDLTNGYHQMPLAKASRAFTAFKTSMGLYEWKRVPMGLRNAAAYFQQCMATEVLTGLVHAELELYIDDILLHAQTEDEFIERLKRVLTRLKQKGIVLSPNKCSFGMKEVEILGHTVNAEGSHFSKEKLQGVLEFPLPATGTQMQSFLGLCNYFRRHVKEIADTEKPLRILSTKFPGSRKIPWENHPEEAKVFQKLKNAVWDCPKLFFYDPHLPVHLHTDACNTGIGAYLFQKDAEGNELPVAFMSRNLRGAELNWSTFEQECFAIHQALKKFEYLLRDVKFTIRTDHRNLLFLNNDASSKVLHWKWDIQQYNFDVEHIPGRDNIVADLYSRLCSIQSDQTTQEQRIEVLASIDTSVNTSRGVAHILAANASRRLDTPRAWMKNNRPNDEEIHKEISKVHGWGTRSENGEVTMAHHGHGGVDRTLRLLRDSLPPSKWWTNMRDDVRKFIKNCPQCQFMQPARLQIHAQVEPFNMSVHGPMDRWNIDTIGPLPKDEDGNQYIIVLVDAFSRFVEMYAAKDVSALSAMKAILQAIGRYGTPSEILTDNGSQYIAELNKQLYDHMITQHVTIMPYSHQENSIVERQNKEVMRHLRAIVFDRKIKTEWSFCLPLIQRVMNASKNSTTGVTPAQLIFGNNIDLDRNILFDSRLRDPNEPLSEYMIKLMDKQAEIVAKAQATQAIVNQQHINSKLKSPRNTVDFAPNQYVLWEYPDNGMLQRDSRPDKISSHYRGPYRVIKSTGSRIEIQNLITMETKTVLSPQLIIFNYDPNVVDPKVVARHANQEFVPDSILAIDGKKGKNGRFLRTDLVVKVHWSGYADSHDTWEPYTNLKFNNKFHNFCNKNNYKYLIPKMEEEDIV